MNSKLRLFLTLIACTGVTTVAVLNDQWLIALICGSALILGIAASEFGLKNPFL